MSKQKSKHIVVLLLVFCLIVGIVSACTMSRKETSKDEETASKQESTGTEPEVDDDKTYVYSMNIHGAEGEWLKCEVLKRWREQFKIEFNFLPITWNDWQQKVMIWMSSGDIPDIMYWDFKLNMSSDYRAWVQAGLLKEIKGIDKYANVKRQLDEMKLDDVLAVNGKKYIWPCTKDCTLVGNIATRGFIYRKDWARQLGLVKEDNIYTWEEMVEIAKQCVEKDPGGVGKNKIAGLACTTWAWPSSLAIEQFTAGKAGWGGYHKKADGTWEWNARLPEYLDAIKELRRLYKEGIIWIDNPLCKGDEPSQKFTAGEIAVYYDNIFAYNLDDKRRKMKENLGVNYEDITYMKVMNPYGKFSAIEDTDFWCVSLFSAKMSDAKFDRLMKAWDWMLSKEGYFTRKIGIRGIDWEFEGDGIKYLWPYNEQTKRYERPEDYPTFKGSLCYDPIGITEGFGFVDPNLKATNAGKDAYDFCMWSKENAVFSKPNYEFSAFSAPNKDKYGSFASDMADAITQIIISSEDVEKDWNEFLKSKADKVNLVIEELNKGLK